MTDTNNPYPITPPPELVASLRNSAPPRTREAGLTRELWLINQAYQDGADQELEACCLWLSGFIGVATADLLREARRRPKPLTLKEQALKALHTSVDLDEFPKQYNTIRLALEALPNA
jgi:hypothetical protein